MKLSGGVPMVPAVGGRFKCFWGLVWETLARAMGGGASGNSRTRAPKPGLIPVKSKTYDGPN